MVSHNHSEDGTWEFLNGLGDERLTVLRPPERVDYASNADWAYHHAKGEWLGHLGDEDQILSSRFAVLDHIASHRIPALRRSTQIGSGITGRTSWPRIGPCPIDYALWCEQVVADLASQVAKGRISPDAAADIQAAGDAAMVEAIGTQTASPGPIGTPVPIEPSWGWRGRLGGGRIEAASITEVGDWFENTFALRQSPTSLGCKRSDEVPVSWVDA